ncbi:aminoglycoside phosphotransferase [Paractinoplanes bogorensis]|uniref:aminoglycoside phosphotransferase n=1 Tax=Paractinoplanes bogorensis TaxID=1610840 RepID=UPI0027E03019|nr:aminoglycoside phosphotransferase [Actinoplanes bogorensis]
MEQSRPRLADAPSAVQTEVEALLGERVVAEHPAGAGFTSSIASVIVGARGRRLFVKAAPDASVRNGVVLAAVGGPRLVGSATVGAWEIAAYEVVDGSPVARWEAANLPPLVAALRDLRRLSPVRGTSRFSEAFVPLLGTWQALHGVGLRSDVDHVRGKPLPVDIPLARLAELESRWLPALESGTALHHGDLRRDNFIRRPDGALVIVDWTHLWTAPGWMDVVRLAPDVAACGHDPEWLLRSVWPDAPADAVNVALAGLAGRAWREWPLPGPAALRHMQQEQGLNTLRWLAQRLVE